MDKTTYVAKAIIVSWEHILLSPNKSKWKCIIKELIAPMSIEYIFK